MEEWRDCCRFPWVQPSGMHIANYLFDRVYATGNTFERRQGRGGTVDEVTIPSSSGAAELNSHLWMCVQIAVATFRYSGTARFSSFVGSLAAAVVFRTGRMIASNTF